jgi:hypothetical protein
MQETVLINFMLSKTNGVPCVNETVFWAPGMKANTPKARAAHGDRQRGVKKSAESVAKSKKANNHTGIDREA